LVSGRQTAAPAGASGKTGRTDIRRSGPANLFTDFCNKIGTHFPFAALHKFGSYRGFI
jgi:hypothetical protein